ncbi:MAG: YggT family protein [Actinobacteria bacterium]|nr:YggT family protein [Actinomycetota bacterium]
MAITFINIISSVVDFYILLIFIYVLMSWFPHGKGFMADLYRVLASLCEPFLGLFRKFIPSLGGIDITPIIAVVVLQLLVQLLVRIII